MATNIQKRGNVYYFRRKIPLDLTEQYGGKREIIRSLGVKDRALAEREARRISVALDDEFEAARRSMAAAESRPQPLPPERMDLAYWDEAASHLLAEETAAHWDAEDEQQERDEAEADRLERVLSIIERRRVDAAVAPLTDAQRAAIAPQRAAAGRAQASGLTLEQIIPLWQRDRQPTAKTVDAVARAVREAGNPVAASLTRQGIIAIRDRWAEVGNSVATINKKIGFVRLLLGVAKSRGMIEANPAEGAELAPPKRAVELRQPKKAEQAEAVMSATEGMRESDSAMYWLPRLARWTGARLNELHQLRRHDLIERDGHPGILITDEGEHAPGVPMRLKNAGSRRWVPLAEPVREFAKWAGAQPDGPLFPAKPNKFGIVSDAFSKQYGKLLRNTLKITDERVTFHSWRHGFADMCRAAGVDAEVRKALMGHTESGVSGTYGAGDGLPAKRLISAVALLSASERGDSLSVPLMPRRNLQSE